MEDDHNKKSTPKPKPKTTKRKLDDANDESKLPRLGHASSSSFPVPSAARGCLEEANAMCSAPSPTMGSNTIQPVAKQFPNNEQWRPDSSVENNNLQLAYSRGLPLEQLIVRENAMHSAPSPSTGFNTTQHVAGQFPNNEQRRLDLSAENNNLQLTYPLEQQLIDRANAMRSAPSPNIGFNSYWESYLFEDDYNVPIPYFFNYDRNSQNISSQVPAHHQRRVYPTQINSHIPAPSNNQFLVVHDPSLITPSPEIANPRAASGVSQSSVWTFGHHQTSYGEQQPRPDQDLVRRYRQSSFVSRSPPAWARQSIFVSQSASALASGTEVMDRRQTIEPDQDETARLTTSDNGAQSGFVSQSASAWARQSGFVSQAASVRTRQSVFVSQSAPAQERQSGFVSQSAFARARQSDFVSQSAPAREMNSPAQDGTVRATTSDNRAQSGSVSQSPPAGQISSVSRLPPAREMNSPAEDGTVRATTSDNRGQSSCVSQSTFAWARQRDFVSRPAPQWARQSSFVSQSAPALASGTQVMNSSVQDGTTRSTTSDNRAQSSFVSQSAPAGARQGGFVSQSVPAQTRQSSFVSQSAPAQARQSGFVSQSASARASGSQEINSPAQDGTDRATTSDRAQNAVEGSSDSEDSSSDYPPHFIKFL